MFSNGLIITAGEKQRLHDGLCGVRAYDREQCDPGYTLFSPSWGDREYLMDMRGLVVHTWPVHHSNVAELHADGNLFTHNCGNWLEELSPDGTVLWRWCGESWMSQPNHHDYAWVGPDEVYTLCSVIEPVRPGMFPPGREPDHLKSDCIVRVRRDMAVDWKFSFSDHVETLCGLAGIPLPIPYADPFRAPREDEDPLVVAALYKDIGSACPADWAHANTIECLPDTPLGKRDGRFRKGNLLFSLRALDTIGIIDPDENAIVWAFGPGLLDGQHQPTMLPNGNILVFDNGTYRGYSVVREIEPATGCEIWSYKNPEEFFSPFRSGNQRLSNGNTFICECDAGRLFEVNPAGDIVWDFYNPFIGEGDSHCGKRIHRATRYSPRDVEQLIALRKDDFRTEINSRGEHIGTLRELLDEYTR